MTPANPLVFVGEVLDDAVDALLCGASGYFVIPAGGYLNCTWLSRKGHYRLTLDVMPGRELDADTAREWHAELVQRFESRPKAPASPTPPKAV